MDIGVLAQTARDVSTGEAPSIDLANIEFCKIIVAIAEKSNAKKFSICYSLPVGINDLMRKKICNTLEKLGYSLIVIYKSNVSDARVTADLFISWY